MTFREIRNLYDNNQFIQLLNHESGFYWLKLRSVSRAAQLREICSRASIDCEGIPARELLEYVYNSRPPEDLIVRFIQEVYEAERSERRDNEDYLVSQLYQMKVFDWGGLYQNSLEQSIVNNYIKKIRNWDDLNTAIENDLYHSMRGYVHCSWYNHWSSILIEDMFKDHPSVLPAVGLVKKVDFFIHGMPFDLKVTYFPDGYMRELRSVIGLRPELTELKQFCRQHEIWFDRKIPDKVLFPELLAKITENPSEVAQNFITEFHQLRTNFIDQTIINPHNLKVWLYENQGIRRFDAANQPVA